MPQLAWRHGGPLVALDNGAELRGLALDLRGLCLGCALCHHAVKRRSAMRWLLLLFLLGCAAEAPNQWQGDSSFGPYYLDASSDTETSDPGAVTVIGPLAWQTATAPSKYSWLKAKAYCGDLTLGGFSDWRLPTIEELEGTIDDASDKCPYIVDTLKATTDCNSYWSSTPFQGASPDPWTVNFAYGGSSNVPAVTSLSLHVRCVRTASSDTETSDPGAVTVIGPLAWQTATAPSKYSWPKAKAHCAYLTLGGFSDWRLPTIEELKGTIDDASEKCPDIVAPLKATTFCDDYWSSTQLQGNTSSAWAVLFSYGYADQMPVNKTGRVRCVR